jgi:acid phosphatase (class A)
MKKLPLRKAMNIHFLESRGLLLALACGVMVGCATSAGSPKPEAVPEFLPGLLQGYLAPEALPDSLALLPAPPLAGSADYAVDEDVARKSIALRGTQRWAQATLDADLSFPNAADTFTCAVDARFRRSVRRICTYFFAAR